MLQDKTILKDILFYYQHQENFRKNYAGWYIIIRNEKIMGHFPSWQEASLKGLELWGEDSFFIKYCA
jgi:hypothetical protein